MVVYVLKKLFEYCGQKEPLGHFYGSSQK